MVTAAAAASWRAGDPVDEREVPVHTQHDLARLHRGSAIGRIRTVGGVTAAAVALALAGCGSAKKPAQRVATACAQRTGFELSLISDRGGRSTPVAAANWFARHGGVHGIPRGGWRLTNENHGSATLASHNAVLHTLQGSDGTWQVDSGYTCTSA